MQQYHFQCQGGDLQMLRLTASREHDGYVSKQGQGPYHVFASSVIHGRSRFRPCIASSAADLLHGLGSAKAR